MRHIRFILLLGVLLGGSLARAAGIYQLQGVDAQFVATEGYGMSPDARAITGRGYDIPTSTSHAFYWSTDAGLVSMATAGTAGLSGYQYSSGRAISSDGSTIVGNYNGGAFKWTMTGSPVELGRLPGYDTNIVEGVSRNGDVIVGRQIKDGGQQTAVIWTLDSGIVDLGSLLPARYVTSGAVDVSDDGATIAGTACQDVCDNFLWSASGGFTWIAPSLPDDSELFIHGFGNDGTTLVGFESPNAGSYFAIAWTSAGGTQPIAEGMTRANDMSLDGNVVVGWRSASEANVWTAELGQSQTVRDYLNANDVPVTYSLEQAVAVSADGRWALVNGYDYSYVGVKAYLVDLTPVPIPPALYLFGSALGLMGAMRRKVTE